MESLLQTQAWIAIDPIYPPFFDYYSAHLIFLLFIEESKVNLNMAYGKISYKYEVQAEKYRNVLSYMQCYWDN